MDEADEYVPQISQLDASSGGYGFASDLSADSYVPPPPVPRAQQQHPYMVAQQQGYYGQQQQQEIPPYAMPPSMTPKSKSKKKKQSSTPQPPAAMMSAAYGAPQQQVYAQQQQQPWPRAGYDPQAYGPRAYGSPYAQGYQQQAMPQQTFYRHSAPPSYYAQQQRAPYPNYPQTSAAQPYYPQQQQQYPPRYAAQAQMQYPQQYQRPMYPQQQMAYSPMAQQRMYQPQQQQSPYVQSRIPMKPMEAQMPPYAPVPAQQQPWPQPPKVPDNVAPQIQQTPQPQTVLGSSHNQELTELQFRREQLMAQPQTPEIQRQIHEVHQKIAFLRNQMTSSHVQYNPLPGASPLDQPRTPQQNMAMEQNQGQTLPVTATGTTTPTSSVSTAPNTPSAPTATPSSAMSPAVSPAKSLPSGYGQAPPPPPTWASGSQTPPPPAPVPRERMQQQQQAPMVRPAVSESASVQPAVSSMAVMLPQGHKGPAVEVNIKPDSRSTTLISVYQYPGAHMHEHPVSAAGTAPLRPVADGQQVVPPEPVPPAPAPPVRVASPTPVPPEVTESVVSSAPAPVAVVSSCESVPLPSAPPLPLEAMAQSTELISSASVSPVAEIQKPKPKAKRTPRKKKEPVSEDLQTPEPQPKLGTDLSAEQPLPSAVVVEPQALTELKPEPSTSKENKPKRPRYATKKPSSKSKKRKRRSFESDESLDEAATVQSQTQHLSETATSSPAITDIPESYLEKRRSSRVTKRKRYNEDNWDLELTEETLPQDRLEGAVEQPVKEEDSMIVEKILLVRNKADPSANATEEKKDNEETTNDSSNSDVEEFLVKYKNYSYLHCEWKNKAQLELGDRRVAQKIRRFKQRRENATTFLDEQFDEDEPFNPDYIQVERVLALSTSQELVLQEQTQTVTAANAEDQTDEQKVEPKKEEEESQESETPVKTEEKEEIEKETVVKKEEEKPRHELVTHFLVKWRSLQYEDCTWELEKDVDSDKIVQFHERRHPHPGRLIEKIRPSPIEWRKVNRIPIFKGGNELRDYQLEGLNWLLFCWYNKQNCILADEMGLGKTIQTITFLVQVQRTGIYGPFLVVAPLSTIHNWQREFETWSSINAVVYHGTSMSRQMIQEYEMYYRQEDGTRMNSVYKFDVLITTYEMVLTDCDELKDIPWRAVIIDEAHRLKNRNCKLLTGLSTFNMEHRVLLTGTPLQNNVDELFSLLNFLEPQQFSCSELFLSEFGSCQTDDQVNKLQEILKPMMLRRLKEDVEKALKPKEETIVEVELTNIQKKYYRAILERNFSYLSKGTSVPSLMNTMMELRKCCNHPFLINGAEDRILNDMRVSHTSVSDSDELLPLALVQSSGKMVLIDKLLPRLRQDGHKVLVFSQMVRCLDLIEEYLVNRKYPFERIDGNVRGDMRQSAIDRFSKNDSDRFVFLLCTRAGGLGINLTAADTVIIFDSDWNPQNDLQAQARCHRIGQEKYVKVYRLITRNTYEREMFDKASRKLGLDKAVLQSMGTKENLAAQLSKKEVEELLKKGAYAAVMNEENEGDKFSEEDIDTILQRRTQTITFQPGVKGSTFAKASFNVSTNREDIDVNDPNFWQKWAKKANVDTEFNPDAALILYEPRQRKRRFNEEMYRMSEESESDSDDENKGRNRRPKRRRGEDVNYVPDELAFTKTDYFKVEKYLSVFGWGRWREILECCEFKQDLSVDDIEHMCRTVLLHCLRQFTGDEKIRLFIWEMITPKMDDAERKQMEADTVKERSPKKRKGHQQQSSHKGGRKSSRITAAKEEDEDDEMMSIYHRGWAALPAYNPPALAVDYAYQRHLQRHANKVLLRVRLLHFLAHDVIGDLADKIKDSVHADKLHLLCPWHPELPVDWWDSDADKSLLIGIYKHGYENFADIREDKTLGFLDRCGSALTPEPATAEVENADANLDKEAADDGEKPEKEEKKEEPPVKEASEPKELLSFPSSAELNARFRRLMTLYQRTSKMSMRSDSQEHMQSLLQEREFRRLEERQRWSRREETDFYRTLISFGVEQDPDTAEQRWERFKRLAKLDTKFDQTLTDYYTAFMAMCKRIARRPLTKAEESLSWIPESLSEERANKVLQRVELLARVRAALRHPKMSERMALCKRTPDLPNWWQAGAPHDLDLLKGIAKHGLSKSDEHIVHDPELCFHDLWLKFQKESSQLPSSNSRTATRSTARGTGEGSETNVTEETGKDPTPETKTEPGASAFDPDMTISQILAQQSGNFFQWPKERMVVFRLQNISFTIEHGEWPSALGARGLGSAVDMDQRSSTPDDTPRDTPGLFGDDNRDSPQLAALFKDLRSATPKSKRTGGRKRGSSALASSVNPLQDLMEAEKERMRALMHQSFLQQLEQFPFAAAAMGFPFGLPSLPTVSSAAQQTLPTASSPAASGTDEALNLSTKAKKSESKKSKGGESSEGKQMHLQDMMAMASMPSAMASMPSDTRVPVLSLKDGTRLTGKDAPTLRNLAQWLSDHPHFIIDMPPHDALAAASAEPELEPGEIVRQSRSDGKSSSPSASDSPSEKVVVINRKNNLKLSGAKGPQLKNLAMWLEKNPDWDIDSSSAQLVKSKANLPEKLKSRIRTEPAPTTKSGSSKAATPPSYVGGMDPFGGLFAPGLDAAAQLQMQMMLQSPFANPALMGFGLPSMPFPMMPSVSAASLTSPLGAASTSDTKKDSDKGSKSKESKKSGAEKKESAIDNPFLAALGHNVASTSPSCSASGGIFGLNPFLSAGMPGLNPNMAALAQLQSLMSMQGIEALMAQQPGAMGLGDLSALTSSSTTTPTTSTSSKRSRAPAKEKASKSRAKTAASPATKAGGRKLDALAQKLAAQKSDTNSPAPGTEEGKEKDC